MEQANSFLSWSPPGKPLTIRLDHDVIDQLNVEVMRGFGVTRRRGTETGGVLIGRIDKQAETVIHIQDYEIVPCEYASGPSFLLSPKDRKNFSDAIAKWRPSRERELYAVGYFRSHTRKGFAFDEEDAKLFREFFDDPDEIALLIKPFATRSATGGWFLQENGGLIANESAFEFEFSSPRKPLNKPNDSRSEPAVGRTASPPPVAEHLPTQHSALEHRPLVARDPATDAETTGFSWKRFLSWAAFGAALLTFGAVCGYEYAGVRLRRAAAESPSTSVLTPGANSMAAEIYSVRLQVQPAEQGLLVKWNREAAPVQSALSGLLTVSEGGNSREVKLRAAELRNGTAIYANKGDDVHFRLELFFQGNRSFVEAVAFRPGGKQP